MSNMRLCAWQHTVRSCPVIFFLGSVLLLDGAVALQAQVTGATLVGTVKDPVNAAVPNAEIGVTRVETNQSRNLKADEQGNYAVPALSPGEYTIKVKAPGFQETVLTGITLEVNQRTRIDISMTVGTVAQSLEVRAGAPLVDTESAQIGAVVSERRVEALPLNGRN